MPLAAAVGVARFSTITASCSRIGQLWMAGNPEGADAHTPVVKLIDQAREVVTSAGGVVRRRDHRELANALDWLVQKGELVRLLPGVVAAAGRAEDFQVLVAAVRLWDPDAVITGRAAARLGYLEELSVETITVLTRRRLKPRAHYLFRRAQIDAGDVVETDEGIRYSSPTWTALWEAAWDEGELADEAMRTFETTPDKLAEGLVVMKGRPGVGVRRFIVANSGEHPWSPLERQVHMMLREAGVCGWSGNHVFDIGGRSWPADVVFPGLKLVIEIDGFSSHQHADVFHDDHEKTLLLLSEGWLTVRFSMPQLADAERFVSWVRDAIAMAEHVAR